MVAGNVKHMVVVSTRSAVKIVQPQVKRTLKQHISDLGKGTVGIEVPNSKPDVVAMKSLIASEKFQNSNMELPVALGKTISNESLITDLTKMPHLLMAGATGQGKSVGLNAILVSIIYKKS